MGFPVLFADAALQPYLQAVLDGLAMGALFALVALGYTMVYGIIELINFAHGDLFMLGTFCGLTVLAALGLTGNAASGAGLGMVLLGCGTMLIVVPLFCAALNWSVDRVVYKPLRNAPKLAPLVSAIGVSFVFMNLGMFWNALVPENGQSVPAPADRNFPGFEAQLDPSRNLLGADSTLRFTVKDAMIIGVTVPIMIALTLFVKYAPLGKAMRATAQNPTAARLMGIDVDRVIGATFMIGGALGGVASVIYALSVRTISFQIGFQNGLYAFTAAVLGGIGNIPGAVLGGILIGLTRSFGSALIGEKWTSALVFVILIVILVFRPTGLLGSRTREKV
ncbi:branched-chain amino acid ABC transporter permease [Gemmata sp. G18]|uniref:Branched-chain amino acid ABC transporter permease n=1 Tax=Gemmata palustris TaxID=2822762 RepID=A0ABS5BV55_9BACT|nr:branched-chain amino acid ABC transporter permease [Gemmata palustris]MBP3957603.1 branched-chain amino acid ABC transporter permease [Gemmata palustris]